MQRAHHVIKWSLMERCDPRLAASVRADYSCRGVFHSPHGNVNYRADGTVKSGHNDTTSGNTLINLAIAASAMRDCGYTGSVIAVGDDLLAAMTTAFDSKRLARAESEYGILPTVIERTSLSQATYASGTWLVDAGRHFYVPLLGRLLARQWWSTHPPPPKRLRAHMHGIASGMLSLVAGLPIYDEFYRPHLIDAPIVDYAGYRPHGRHDFSAVDVYAALRSRYGLSDRHIDEARVWVASLPTSPRFYEHLPRSIQTIMAVDVPDALIGRAALEQLRHDGVIDSAA
nr:MAG: hypothetical protein [Owegonang virus 4]